MRSATSLFREETGTTSVEYAIMLAFMLLAMFAGIATFGRTMLATWNTNNSTVSAAAGG